MEIRKAVAYPVIGLLACFVTGCSDATHPSAPPRKLTQIRVVAVAPVGRELQTASGRLASQIANFGGAFISNGMLNVYLTDMAQQNNASQAITAQLAQDGRSQLRVRLIQGKFRYADLENWRRSLLPALGGKGMVFSEIDERANRVRIGVLDRSGQATMEGLLLRLDAPREAFIVDLVPAPVLYTTLQDKYRPLRAGFQITGFWSQNGNQYAICTHGPNVNYEDSKYMVVNSHCTQNESVGGLIGAAMYQPSVSTGNYFGTEVSDPPFESTTFGCPTGNFCRYSDAALVQVSSTVTWEIAAIARPLGPPATLPALYGSLTIDGANPKFTLTSVLQSLFIGDTLHKVGRTTGWTKGVVVSTCRDITIGVYTRLCSGAVSAGAGHGDSGSPVFFQSGNGAYLLRGLLFGGLVGSDGIAGSEYYFSNWSWVSYELGITGPLDPITPPTPPCSPGPC